MFDELPAIDGHSHLHSVSNPTSIAWEGTQSESVAEEGIGAALEEWLANMSSVGIERTITFDWDNDETDRLIERAGGRLHGMVVADPRDTANAIAAVERLVDGKRFVGVKCSPAGDYSVGGGGYYPDEPACFDFYDYLQSRDIPMLMHTGIIFRNAEEPDRTAVKYCRPILLDGVARRFPRLRIVVGHVGRPFWDETLALANQPNVSVDLTWSQLPLPLYRRSIRTALEGFGAERTIFGSDSNLVHTDRCVVLLSETRRLLADLGVSVSQAARILHGTANDLYWGGRR